MCLTPRTLEVIMTLTDLLIKGKSPKDKQGKNLKKNTISAEVCSKINEDISSLPTKITHYGTRDTLMPAFM